MLNHVCLHQTVIGLEAKEQMKLAGDYPDVVIGCHGGGSNFAGIGFPFVADKAAGKQVRILAVEPSVLPDAHEGRLRVRLRRHRARWRRSRRCTRSVTTSCRPASTPAGCATTARRRSCRSSCTPGMIEARAVGQLACFEAAVLFARTEGIIPAPESSHAIRGAIDEALRAKEEGKERIILFNLSGHGHVDMAAYDAYFAGQLEDFEYPAERVKESLAHLPKVAL